MSMSNLGVVSLETSKRLKAVGFPQWPSTFYWDWWGDIQMNSEAKRFNFDEVAAPTAQEIADQLPHRGWELFPWMDNISFAAAVNDADSNRLVFPAATMAEALALLWLKLQEAK